VRADYSIRVDTTAGIPFGFLPKDEKTRLRRIKLHSACGPDRIGKAEIIERRGHATLLAKVYNILLISGLYPNEWRRNRTTLIPKGGKDLAVAKTIVLSPSHLCLRGYTRVSLTKN
jgi:hypothetical protein